MVGRFGPWEVGNDAAFAHNVDVVSETYQLFELGRRHDDYAVFLASDSPQEAVDFSLGMDVDSLQSAPQPIALGRYPRAHARSRFFADCRR